MRNVAVLEGIKSRFELSIHLSVFFPHELLSRELLREKDKKMYGNFTGRFLAQLHRSNSVEG